MGVDLLERTSRRGVTLKSKSVLLAGFFGAIVLLQSGCATMLLSEKISRDHRYIYYHHRDEDRIDHVEDALITDQGTVRILYTGSHGPKYQQKTYQMTLPANKMDAAKRRATDPGNSSDIELLPVTLKRRATRRSDHLNTRGEWTHLTHRAVKKLHDLDLNALKKSAGEHEEKVHVLFSNELKGETLPPGSPSHTAKAFSTGLGILYPGESPEHPALLVVPYVPRKETHDFSGLGYRCLYPIAVAWDVVTFPVQAVAVFWVLNSSSGGWLF